MIEPRLNLVTLGVASVPESRAFYERLGWRAERNVRSTAAVNDPLAAEAKPLKPPCPVFWGGDSGPFADPDGFSLGAAHNVLFERNEAGAPVLPA